MDNGVSVIHNKGRETEVKQENTSIEVTQYLFKFFEKI